MSPRKVDRARVSRLEDLPSIGKAMAADLRLIGIRTPKYCSAGMRSICMTHCAWRPGCGTTRA